MNEAKWELKNWKKWKRVVQLLEETKNDLLEASKGSNVDYSELPGGSHRPISNKFNKTIEECEKYDVVISQYKFFINRLEKALTEMLSEQQREVCIIYANHPNNSREREMVALKRGYAQATYYRLLKESFDVMDLVLVPLKFDSNLIVNKQKNDV